MGRRSAYGRVALLLVLTATAVGTGPLAPPAAACSCPARTPAQLTARADVVLVGTLVAHRVDEDARSDKGTFAVQEVRKGVAAPRQEVLSSLNTAGCGAGPWRSGSYLLYASGPGREDLPVLVRPGQLYVASCGGVSLLTSTEAAALGLPAAPSVDPADRGPGPGAIVVVLAAALAALVGTAVVRRRRRSIPSDLPGGAA